jgi:hypothetical protein
VEVGVLAGFPAHINEQFQAVKTGCGGKAEYPFQAV